MSADDKTDPEMLEAFDEIVAEYEAALLRYAARIVRNSAAAQDVVQTTFIKLFRFWKDDSKPSPQLSAWLYRVTHNGAVDYLRKETRHSSLLRRHAEEHDCLHQEGRSRGLVSEQAERAARCLSKISLREQQIVVLKVYEEKSYREISQITGLSEGNVGYILHHAMKKLAALTRQTTNDGDPPDVSDTGTVA
jgi:RNA polymerase sigma factor (sigma-70 family)